MPEACWRARPPFSSDNKAHGRITHHEVRVVAVDAETIGLPFARAIISVTRTAQSTKEGAQPIPGRRFFVTSLGPEECRPEQFAEHIRGHWGIENKNHWEARRAMGRRRATVQKPKNRSSPRHPARRAPGPLPRTLPHALRPPSAPSPRRRPPRQFTPSASQVKSPG
jgi:hypothetical protein